MATLRTSGDAMENECHGGAVAAQMLLGVVGNVLQEKRKDGKKRQGVSSRDGFGWQVRQKADLQERVHVAANVAHLEQLHTITRVNP